MFQMSVELRLQLCMTPDSQCVYITDIVRACVKKFTLTGDLLCKSTMPLSAPHGAALACDGGVIVCDFGKYRVVVLSPDLSSILRTFSVSSPSRKFSGQCTEVCVAGERLYVLEQKHQLVHVLQ